MVCFWVGFSSKQNYILHVYGEWGWGGTYITNEVIIPSQIPPLTLTVRLLTSIAFKSYSSGVKPNKSIKYYSQFSLSTSFSQYIIIDLNLP